MNPQLWESPVPELPPRASGARLVEPFRPDFNHVQLNLLTMLSAEEESHFDGPALWYYGLFLLFGPPLLTTISSLCGLGEGAPVVGHKDIRGVKTLPLEVPSEIDPVIYLQGWLVGGGGDLVTMV